MGDKVQQYLSGSVNQGEGVQSRMNSRFFNSDHYSNGTESYFLNSRITQQVRLSDRHLEIQFIEYDTVRKICTIPALEMTRAGVEFYKVDSTPEDEDIKAIEKAWNALEIDCENEKGFVEAFKMGGGVAIINFDDGKDWDQPVTDSKGILSIKVVDRRYCIPMPFAKETAGLDMNSPDFGIPEHYQVNYPVYSAQFSQLVHKSRIIRFMPPYTGAYNEVTRHTWGEPRLTHIYKKLKQDEISHDEAAELIPKFITDTFKSDGKSAGIMKGNDTILGDPRKRLNESMSKSAIGKVVVLKMDETFDKVTANIAGLAELLGQYPKRTAAAAEIPFSRLYYAEGGALNNSTVEEENKTFEKTTQGWQRGLYRPVVKRWLECLSTYLNFDVEGVLFKFAPLTEASPLEEAQIAKLTAETDVIYEGGGIVTAQEIRDTRFKDKAVPDLKSSYQLDNKSEKLLEQAKEHELTQPIESHDMTKEMHDKNMEEPKENPNEKDFK